MIQFSHSLGSKGKAEGEREGKPTTRLRVRDVEGDSSVWVADLRLNPRKGACSESVGVTGSIADGHVRIIAG